LQDFYIYLHNYNAVFTPSSVFVRPEDYYDLYHFQNLDPARWKEEILNKIHHREILPARPFMNDGKSTSVITYLQSLPIDSFQHSLGTAVILIDESEITKMLEPISKQYGGWVYIYDKDGNIISKTGIDEPHIKDENTMLISSKSDYNGWVYVVGLPKRIVFKIAYFIEKVTWMIAGSTLFFGILAALLLAYRNSTPLNKLMAVFGEQADQGGFKGKNEYDFLQGTISNLIANNKSMEEERKRQLPLLKDAFVKRLIKGEFDSAQEVKAAMLSLPDISLQGEFGHVGIIRINGYSSLVSEAILHELNATRLIIKKILQENCGPVHMNITDLDSDKIAVLFTYVREPDSSVCEKIAEMFDHLREYVRTEYRIQLTVCIGNSFHRLSDVSRSFDEARQALDYAALLEEQKTLWYRDIVKESTTYYYPIDLELRMMNAVKIGELPEVKRIFAQIFEENFVERKLSAEMAQQLFVEMKGTLFKLLQQNIFADPALSEQLKYRVEHIQRSASLDKIRGDMEHLFEAFCNLVMKKKQDERGEIIDKILKFLETRYADSDLNLYRVSEAVGLPEKYISQLFKEQTGENLSDYLEKIRIKKATDLLFNSDQTIDEISQNVGYNSAHAFRRAFKRVSGVSPSLYRKTVN
jgi:AraC-like DNA-binding protein